MNKMLKILISSMIMLVITLTTAFADDIKIRVNGESLNFNEITGIPFIDSNYRTQVPLRVALEKYGAKVEWNQEKMSAIVMLDDITVEVPIGQNYILKNSEKILTDSSALIKNGRTYLPIRPVFEALEAVVAWDEATKTVEIKKDSSIDKKYNSAMSEQEANKANYGIFVYDKNYQYFIVESEYKTYEIKRKNVNTKVVDTLHWTENQIDDLTIYDNCLYFIESKSEYSKIKKLDLKTLVVEDIFLQPSYSNLDDDFSFISDFTIYNNKIYVSIFMFENNKCRNIIGVVENNSKLEKLYEYDGVSYYLYCYNSKIYFSNDNNMMQYDLITNEVKVILGMVYECTFNKNKIYFSDYKNIYVASLDNLEDIKLLYRLDETKFTNSEASITDLNMHNGKLYFTISPDWMIYYLDNNGKPKIATYTKEHTEFFSVYGDNFFYYNDSNLAYMVGGPNIKVAETPTLDEWIMYGKKQVVEELEPRYNFSITNSEKEEALEVAKKGIYNIYGYMLNNGYYPLAVESEYNKYIGDLIIYTPRVAIMLDYINNISKYNNVYDDKNFNELYEEEFIKNKAISFLMNYICLSNENPKDISVYIEQGNYRFYADVFLLDAQPEMTENYPDFPAYCTDMFIYLSNTNEAKIDLNKRAKLVIVHDNSNNTSTFIIDFAKIKN